MKTLFFFTLVLISVLATSSVNPEDIKIKNQQVILIKNGNIVNHDQVKNNLDILVSGGKIQQIGKNLKAPSDVDHVIDATGKFVIPGGIDPHVHMALPFMGTVSKDDFYTGTKAALAGGTTMIMDFAIAMKGQSLIDIYKSYRKKGDNLALSSYGLHMGISEFNDKVAKEIKELTENHGINSFKVFMAYKGVFMLDDSSIFQVMKTASGLGAITMVHAENGELVVEGQKRMKELGILGPEGHPLSRPANIEGEAVHRATILAEQANSPVYIVHVMSNDALEEVRRAKARGVRVIGEPVLAGLSLTSEGYKNPDWDVASRYVMSPPIRSKAHQEKLIQGLRSGLLSIVGTDHCAFDTKQKRMGRKDFTLIPNGCNGVEDRLNVLWTNLVAKRGILSPSDFVRVTSTEAAKVFNIYPRKGSVSVGADADIAILDPNASKTISAKTHYQNIDYNVFEGFKTQGHVISTISLGRLVYHNGKFIEDSVAKGDGLFIPTPPFSPRVFSGLDKENKSKEPIAVNRTD